MITLNKNYKIKTDSNHGFILLYESDPYEKESIFKGETTVKTLTRKESYFYPKLSMCLQKFFVLSLVDVNSVELLPRIKNIERIIKTFEKTFSKKGSLIELNK